MREWFWYIWLIMLLNPLAGMLVVLGVGGLVVALLITLGIVLF